MAYQRGSLRIVSRKGGDVWMLRYRLNAADGKRKENTAPVGLLKDFPTEKAAWREVDRLGLLIRINSEESVTRIRFDALAEYTCGSGPCISLVRFPASVRRRLPFFLVHSRMWLLLIRDLD